MSSRSSKTTKKTTQVISSTTTSGEQSGMRTPQTGSSARSEREGRPRSPLSPTRISRLQEKLDLQNLNDRLATYIDRVRYLENENSRLQVQVQTTQETITREVSNVKSMYEQELSDARKLLDDTAKEKAKMQIEASKWKNEADELQGKANDLSNKLNALSAKKDKECSSYEKRIIILETQNSDIESRYKQQLADVKKHNDQLLSQLATQQRVDAENKKRTEEELKALRAERDKLSKQLAVAKSQLEEETLHRVDLENRFQSLKEELAFKQSVHEKQLSETRLVKQTEISEIDNRMKDQYDRKLADTLRELRDQYETQLAINREELESMYESKMDKLQAQVEAQNENTSSTTEEIRSLRTRTQNLSSKISDLESQNSALANRIRDLERMLEQEREWHLKSVQEKESEIQRLRSSINEQLKEYQDLLDIKVALDLEIAAYRKLLESEESRLNITPASSPLVEDGSQGRGTPVRRTPVRATKRKRTIVIQSEKKSTSDKYTSATAKGDIEVFDHCPQGKFVKLYNKGSKDVALSGWQLIRQVGDQEVTYKFHRNIVMKADSYITVWSSDSEVTHTPPSDLVMKNQAWPVGEKMATRLINTSGDEVAIRESSRHVHLAEKSHETGSYLSSGDDEIYHQQGDPENPQERCSIM